MAKDELAGRRIAVVSQYFAPEDARIPTDVADRLATAGATVTVITAFPSYPHGRIYPGFQQSRGHVERRGEVDVHRVPTFISHSRNPVTRVASYLSFARASMAARKFVRDADVVYVYATQMTAAIGPYWWRVFGGSPYVLHVQDLWPESVTQSSMVGRGRIAALIGAIMTPFLTSAYRRAAAVVAIAPTMRTTLVARGCHAESTVVVPNWARDVVPPPSSDLPPRESDQFTVTYAGNLGVMQDLAVVVEAAAILREHPRIAFRIVGDGAELEGLRTLAGERGADTLEFVGRVPLDEMRQIYAESDVQLVTLKPLDIFKGTIPSKLSESVANGVPVITNVEGDAAEIVTGRGLGLAVAPSDAEALARAIEAASDWSDDDRERYRAACLAYARDELSLDSAMSELETVLLAACGDAASHPTKGVDQG